MNWISCYEKLPGLDYAGEDILVSVDGKVFAYTVADDLSGVYDRFECLVSDGGFYEWDEIDAWMDFPEPYESEEE